MLQHLTIKNFVLIDQDDIVFEPGMSVITGETGAGKSILIDALSLVLGARADSKMVRHGADRLDVTASFSIESLKEVHSWLQENDLAESSECLLRRVITTDGKSRAFINGQPVTLQQLSQLGASLVEIHGQHQHHFLIKKSHQLFLLDAFAQHHTYLDQIQNFYKAWQELEKEKMACQALQHNVSQAELIRFQLDELLQLALLPGELPQLESEYKVLSQAEDILLRTQTSLNSLIEQDKNLLQQLKGVQQQLAPLNDLHESLTNANKNLEQARLSLDETVLDLRSYLSHFDLNPNRLAVLSDRLEHIHRLARKHRVRAEELVDLSQQLQDQLHRLEQADQQLAKIEAAQQTIMGHYQKVAQQLTASRLKAADALSTAISAQMQQLAMVGGSFTIQFQPQAEGIHAHGQEHCEFWVKPNPGQPAQPLSKIASGGELSRISLAIQVILASLNVIPTLIFDEVDVGIGGATATIVGQLLQQLGQRVQVLCVTHLPQVAVFASQHYQVEKNILDDQTCTALKKLNGKARQQEIARMLGGKTISPQSLAHAKELMQQAGVF